MTSSGSLRVATNGPNGHSVPVLATIGTCATGIKTEEGGLVKRKGVFLLHDNAIPAMQLTSLPLTGLCGKCFINKETCAKHTQTSLRPKSQTFTSKGFHSSIDVGRRC
ncbi:hypothetical protein NPIL_17991 [Nephila pilipes]|uniref:Uncharacterized protein n=1 Tax=Nephila pilipes TaxID=299642 RepID=A0A8X6NMP3_NEPPI|nr:hypothetical protein NPIL_17991 [Nephila pilipes]